MVQKLDFLSSRRFWCLVVAAVVGVLKTEGVLPSEVADALITVTLGFVAIGTADKFSKALK
jgi:hypothetical protein